MINRHRLSKRQDAQKVLKEIGKNKKDYLIIHYSCESFIDTPKGASPRITTIGIRYLNSAQTKSFSIHKYAEIQKIDDEKIDEKYDELEKMMLIDYYDFVSKHQNYKCIHINMRDENYGFEAIARRFRVLGGTPVDINDQNKIDFARLLVNLYGSSYIGHPRFENLYKLNRITMDGFLTGKEEAEAFTKKEYLKLHFSTLRKIDNLNTVIEKCLDNILKTNAKFKDIYGISPGILFIYMKENWLLALVFLIIGGVLINYISHLLGI
jgi:hypothetical protein